MALNDSTITGTIVSYGVPSLKIAEQAPFSDIFIVCFVTESYNTLVTALVVVWIWQKQWSMIIPVKNRALFFFKK